MVFICYSSLSGLRYLVSQSLGCLFSAPTPTFLCTARNSKHTSTIQQTLRPPYQLALARFCQRQSLVR